jgi:hypothetical protein
VGDMAIRAQIIFQRIMVRRRCAIMVYR